MTGSKILTETEHPPLPQPLQDVELAPNSPSTPAAPPSPASPPQQESGPININTPEVGVQNVEELPTEEIDFNVSEWQRAYQTEYRVYGHEYWGEAQSSGSAAASPPVASPPQGFGGTRTGIDWRGAQGRLSRVCFWFAVVSDAVHYWSLTPEERQAEYNNTVQSWSDLIFGPSPEA